MGIAILLIYIQGVIEARPYPMNTFLPAPATRFGDFFGTFSQYAQAKGLGGVGYGVAYFPATYLPIQALVTMTSDPWRAMWISQITWIFGSIVVIFYTLRSKGFLVSAVAMVLIIFSYPSLLAFHTGNIEGWTGFLLLVAAALALRNSWLSFGVVVGVMGALKGVPMVFLLIPWFTCKWKVALRATAASLLTAAFLTLTALFFLPHGILSSGLSGATHALTAIRKSQAMYTELMVNGAAGIHYGHSILNTVHAIWGMGTLPSPTWGPILFIVVIILLVLVMILLRRLQAPIWMKFAVVGSIGCLAPATSTDYKLLYLAPALLAFLAAIDVTSPWTIGPICLVVFAMSPKPWLYVGTDPFGNATVYLTTAALLAIPLVCLAAMAMHPNEPQKLPVRPNGQQKPLVRQTGRQKPRARR